MWGSLVWTMTRHDDLNYDKHTKARGGLSILQEKQKKRPTPSGSSGHQGLASGADSGFSDPGRVGTSDVGAQSSTSKGYGQVDASLTLSTLPPDAWPCQ